MPGNRVGEDAGTHPCSSKGHNEGKGCSLRHWPGRVKQHRCGFAECVLSREGREGELPKELPCFMA